MRQIALGPFTPAAASTTRFATGLTGPGPFTTFTNTTTGDNLAHLVTIASAANISTSTLTITGTDKDGYLQTEAIVGPNISTVTTTKHFLTISSITASVSLGASTMDVGISAVCKGQSVPIEWRSNAAAAITVALSGTINVTVNETYGNVYGDYPPIGPLGANLGPSALPWTAITALTSKTSTTSGAATLGSTALDVLVNSATGGTFTLYIAQPSGFAV